MTLRLICFPPYFICKYFLMFLFINSTVDFLLLSFFPPCDYLLNKKIVRGCMIIWNRDSSKNLMLQTKQGLDPTGGSTVMGNNWVINIIISSIIFRLTPCQAKTATNVAATVLK